jgi:hypothetical protein
MYKQGVDYVFGLGVVYDAPHRSRNSRRTYAFDSSGHIYSAQPVLRVRGRVLNGAIRTCRREVVCRVQRCKQRVTFQDGSHTDGARRRCSTANGLMQDAKVVLALDS